MLRLVRVNRSFFGESSLVMSRQTQSRRRQAATKVEYQSLNLDATQPHHNTAGRGRHTVYGGGSADSVQGVSRAKKALKRSTCSAASSQIVLPDVVKIGASDDSSAAQTLPGQGGYSASLVSTTIEANSSPCPSVKKPKIITQNQKSATMKATASTSETETCEDNSSTNITHENKATGVQTANSAFCVSPARLAPSATSSSSAASPSDATPAASATSPSAGGSARLGREFFDVPGETLARALLGQKLVRFVDGVRLCAKIVETEAYLGAVDKAAHSYKKQTDRNKAMFMQPGTAYVYNIYGMYCCLNISSRGEGCAVLIRSVEPVEGIEKMKELRQSASKKSVPNNHSLSTTKPSVSSTSSAAVELKSSNRKAAATSKSAASETLLSTNSSSFSSSASAKSKAAAASSEARPKLLKVRDLGNGPSKLCQSLAITKDALNQRDLVTDCGTWLERGGAVSSNDVVVSARINIAYAEEWTSKLLRFYIVNNPCVSVKDTKSEAAVKEGTQSQYFPG